MNRSLAIVILIAFGLAAYFFVAESENSPIATLRAISEPVFHPDTKPLQLLFTGDLMIDRGVSAHAAARGADALLAGVKDLFAGMDAIVPNLEGTITNNPSVSLVNHADLRFTFDPHFAPYLKDKGITAVSLSNNHSDDFGTDGYLQTKTNLGLAGIESFGSPANDRDLSLQMSLRNRNVCFVGYEGFIHTDPAPIAAEIIRIRPTCDFVVATMHAGEEYHSTFTVLQQDAAHAFIDAGADVVIGTHPHVVEPLELYKGKPIFYSLGNFLFDQDFSWATEHGLAVRITRTGNETRYTLIPVTVQNGEASVTAGADDIQRTLLALIGPSLPSAIVSSIKTEHSFVLK